MEQIQKKFVKQQTINLFTLGLIYALVLLCRYNFTASHPALSHYLGWDYKDFGIITSISLFIYGLSVIINGSKADQIGGKKAILKGLLGSFLANILFGLSYFLILNEAMWANKKVIVEPVIRFGLNSSFVVLWMCTWWGFNAFSQSYVSTSIVKINSAWNPPNKRARLAGYFGALLNIGRVLVYAMCPFIVRYLPWYWVFWLPATLLLIGYLTVSYFVVEDPSDVGLEEKVDVKEYSIKDFWSTTILLSCFMAFFIGCVRAGMDQWVARYFSSNFNQANDALMKFGPYFLFSIIGPGALILSNLVLVPLSDKIGRHTLITGVLFTSIWLLFSLSHYINSPYIACFLIVGIIFCVQAAHATLMGVLVMDLVEKRYTATLAGWFDGVSYMSGAAITYIIANVLDKTKYTKNEWSYWPLLLIAPTIIAIIFTNITRRQQNARN